MKMRHQGLTLVELVVAIALFALLSVLGWQIMGNLHRNYEHIQQKSSHISQLSDAYMTLSQDFLWALPYQAGIATPSVQAKDTLVFILRYSEPNPSAYATLAYWQVVYRLQEGRLIREQYVLGVNESFEGQSPVSTVVLLENLVNPAWQVEYDAQQTDKIKGIGLAFEYQDMPIAWLWTVGAL